MSAKVLVVDDIDINVRLLEAKLLSEYYEVLTASNGVRALELAAKEAPDIILLDVMMPGMDGLEVCRRLKADPQLRYIPVVMVTALGDTSDRLRGLAVGADDFLTKPVNDIALFARVRSLIRLKRTMDEWLMREEINGQLAALPGTDNGFDGDEPEPANIILLEDNPLAASKLSQILRPIASNLTVVGAIAEAHARAVLGQDDLLVLSMSLEREDPLRLVSQLRAVEQTRHIPILLVLEENDYPRLAKGLDLGANDYIIRPVEKNEFEARVRSQIKRKRLQDRLHENYRRGLAMALTDGLTSLYNRRYLNAHLETLFGRSGIVDAALLMFDIDRFKLVNDTHGHAVGDEVLVEVARRALAGVRGFDLIARYGGEEFVIVMPDCTPATAGTVADRIRRTIGEKPTELKGEPGSLTVTISVGVAVATPETRTPAQLLKRADQALYAAKNAGRNQVMLWYPNGPQPYTETDSPVI